MIYVLNYYSRILLPKWRSSKVQRISDEPDCAVIRMVVVGLQTYPDTVFNIDGVNKTPNLTFQINSSNGSPGKEV